MSDKEVYLTREGRERFTAELHELQTVRRHEVEERFRQAKELADTVDNDEYDEVKNEQAFVQGRILELEQLLADAQIIEEPQKADFIRMGSHVTVVNDEGEEEHYHLVGSPEADPRKGLISNESPIGRALLGKRIGEETTVVAPGGSFTLRVASIR